MKRNEKVIGCIKEHLGEEKLLSEWKYIINGNLPKNLAMSTRELAKVFRVSRGRGEIEFDYDSYPPIYRFREVA